MLQGQKREKKFFSKNNQTNSYTLIITKDEHLSAALITVSKLKQISSIVCTLEESLDQISQVWKNQLWGNKCSRSFEGSVMTHSADSLQAGKNFETLLLL